MRAWASSQCASARSHGQMRVGKAHADKERHGVPLGSAPRVVGHVQGISIQVDLQEARLAQSGRVAHERRTAFKQI